MGFARRASATPVCANAPCPHRPARAVCEHDRHDRQIGADPDAFDRVRGAVRRRILSCAERHDAVAAGCDLSEPEIDLRSGLHPCGSHHPHLPDHRLAAAAAGRRVHRPPRRSLCVAGGNGVHLLRADRSCDRADLSAAARGIGAGRHWFVYVSSRKLTRRTSRGRHAARTCAIHVPGRRQHRRLARPTARGLRNLAGATHRRRLVFRRRPARHRHPVAGGRMVSPERHHAAPHIMAIST